MIFTNLGNTALSKVKLQATRNLPEFILDPERKYISIKGRFMASYKDAMVFIRTIEDWISKYALLPHTKTTIDVYCIYVNTRNKKRYFSIFEHFQEVLNPDEIVLNWYYDREEEDVLEDGEILASKLKLPVNFIDTSTNK